MRPLVLAVALAACSSTVPIAGDASGSAKAGAAQAAPVHLAGASSGTAKAGTPTKPSPSPVVPLSGVAHAKGTVR